VYFVTKKVVNCLAFFVRRFHFDKLGKDPQVIWGSGGGGLETFQIQVLNFAAGDRTPRSSVVLDEYGFRS
jgi:hypothetical protein